MLIKEKDLGKGCRDCRFLNDLKVKAECIADPRVNVYMNDAIDEYRPYRCPFRYFDDHHNQIVNKFYGKSEDETKGYFDGMNYIAEKYVRLEK